VGTLVRAPILICDGHGSAEHAARRVIAISQGWITASTHANRIFCLWSNTLYNSVNSADLKREIGALKLAGDPNNPVRFKEDATTEELRAEIMRRLGVLQEAGVIDLTALPTPKRGVAN